MDDKTTGNVGTLLQPENFELPTLKDALAPETKEIADEPLRPDIARSNEILDSLRSEPIIPYDLKIGGNVSQFFTSAKILQENRKYSGTPGFFDSTFHSFKVMNEFSIVDEYLNQGSNLNNILIDPLPYPEWTPKDDIEQFSEIGDKYRYLLLNADSPIQMNMMADDLREREHQDEFYSHGSIFSQAVGFGLGGVVSPSTYILGLAELKGGFLAKATLGAYERAFLHGSSANVVHNALDQSMVMGGSLEAFISQTIVDEFAVLGLMGFAKGLAITYNGWKTFNSAKVLAYEHKGLKMVPVLGETGELVEIRPKQIPGTSASAADWDEAREFGKDQLDKGGLFGIPRVGELFGKAAGKVNPIFRGLNSRFPSLSQATNYTAEHGLITTGTIEGIAREETFEGKWMVNTGENTSIVHHAQNLWRERNGVTQGIGKGTQTVIKKVTDSDYVTELQFYEEVSNALVRNEESPHAAVNKLNSYIQQSIHDVWMEYQASEGLSNQLAPVRFAKTYLNRMYNIERIVQDPDNWNDMYLDYIPKANAKIRERLEPIEQAQDLLKEAETVHSELLRTDYISGDELLASERKVELASSRVQALKDKLTNQMREEEGMDLLVHDWNALSAKEAEALTTLLKPLKDLQETLEGTTSKLKATQRKIKRTKTSMAKLKTEKGVNNAQVKLDKLIAEEAELDKLHSETGKLEFEENKRLQIAATKGEIDPHLFYRVEGSHEAFFKEDHDLLRFIDLPQTEKEILELAFNTAETIKNQTPEQVLQNIARRDIRPSDPKATKKRTVPIPDEKLYEYDVMLKNPLANLLNYKNALRRRIYHKEVYSKITPNGRLEELHTKLVNENRLFQKIIREGNDAYKHFVSITPEPVGSAGFKAKLKSARSGNKAYKDHMKKNKKNPTSGPKHDRAKKEYQHLVVKGIIKPPKVITEPVPKGPKQAKALSKLNREFESAQTDLGHIIDTVNGKITGNPDFLKFQRANLLVGVTTQLGGVALTMPTDLVGITYKAGVVPFIVDGLIPFFKTLNGKMKTSEAEFYRENGAQAHMTFNHVHSIHTHRYLTPDAIPYVPSANKVMSGLESVAGKTGTLYGVAQIENALQAIAANMTQGRIILRMIKYSEGRLSKAEHQDMLLMGLDPELWHERFINGWNEAGGVQNNLGGYQSQYWKWTDTEAKKKFAHAVMTRTKDIIIRRGMMDAPNMMKDPFMQNMFMFKGYLFSSITRYTLPLLQNPDIDKVVGTMLMLWMGAQIQPFRRYAAGQPMHTDKDEVMRMAFEDSNVASILTPMGDFMNLASGGKLFGSHRDAGKSTFQMMGGPTAGLIANIFDVGYHLAKGNFSQKQLDSAARAIPVANAAALRPLWAFVKKTSGLPVSPEE